jgi:hypothetical protein
VGVRYRVEIEITVHAESVEEVRREVEGLFPYAAEDATVYDDRNKVVAQYDGEEWDV